MSRLGVILVVVFVCALSAFSSIATAATEGQIKIANVKTTSKSKTTKNFSGVVRWDHRTLSRAGTNDRFQLRLVSLDRHQHKPIVLVSKTIHSSGQVSHFDFSASSETAFKSGRQLYLTATQQYDSPKDKDKLYERNKIAISAISANSKSARASAAPVGNQNCSNSTIGPSANLSNCNLVGANLSQSNLANANLSGANVTGVNVAGANLNNVNWGADQQSAFVEPNDNGQTVTAAINSAKSNIDIVIYDFGGPNIVGQVGASGSLMNAVQRGVDVRLILNGQVQDSACTGSDPTSQASCAWNPKYDAVYAAQASLQAAAAAAGPGAGKVTVQFASNQFNITHQKTIIIDSVDGNGNALPATSLPATATALVMTGNLQAFPSYWGQRSVSSYDSTQKKYVNKVVNQNYLTNPAAACQSQTSAPCGTEWAARDFGISVTDPTMINRIESVFVSDLQCGGTTAATNTNNLLGTTMADTWSNGMTFSGSYPDVANGGYFPASSQPPLPSNGVIQGNAKQRILDLIGSATTSLTVYNEEMADSDIIAALGAAGKKLPAGSVQVVMAGKVNSYNNNATAFNTLLSNGVQIRLIDSSKPSNVYIHAKVIVADGTNAFIGSENISYPSLAYNRELGLMVTNSATPQADQMASTGGLALFASTFETDWNNGTPWTQQTPSTNSVNYSSSPTFPMMCGTLPTRTMPPPPSEQPAS